MSYVGRFAPSPTGALHFGSVLAAMVSYLRARERGGAWLVRMEDIDPPREQAGAAEAILEGLARLGLQSDAPVLFQSSRLEAYAALTEQLIEQDLAFWCACKRKQLPRGEPYPGYCRHGLPDGAEGRSVRLRTDSRLIEFDDVIQGHQAERLSDTCGDYVIRRADGLVAYQLAVVADDIEQGITEVVRGSDLLNSTARQHYLFGVLGAKPPAWYHFPVALNELGRKLSKQTFARTVSAEDPLDLLSAAWTFMGQEAMDRPASVPAFWLEAEQYWDSERVPRQMQISAPQAFL